MKRTVRICLIEGAGCEGCALEAQSALTRPHGAARRGIRAVETPAHADVLVVCGPLPSPLADELRRLEGTLPAPQIRVHLGDCAPDDTAATMVPGCPPSPEEILGAVAAAWGTGSSRPTSPEQEGQP